MEKKMKYGVFQQVSVNFNKILELSTWSIIKPKCKDDSHSKSGHSMILWRNYLVIFGGSLMLLLL
jgi:hypothetical protein